VQQNFSNQSANQTTPKKLIEDVSQAPQEHLNQTIKPPNEQPKSPQSILWDPSIINIICQTCINLTCKEVMKINDVVCKLDTRPLIKIKSGPILVGKWLFDTGAWITCVSLQQFRLIPIERRPFKINLYKCEARVMQTATVFKNLLSPLLFGIDAIDNSGITYLSRTKNFIFQENLEPKGFQKADFKIISTLKIPVHTRLLVRLGPTLGRNKESMPGCIKTAFTIASMEFPYLFAPRGLVSTDHLGQFMIILRNCKDEDVIFARL
jgi:hypothetical protein